MEKPVKCMHGCPYHPATGHILDRKTMAVLCGMHARYFLKFVKSHTGGWANRKRRGKVMPDFYAEAATSIKARSESG